MSEVPADGRRWELVTGCGSFADLAGSMYVTRDALGPGEEIRFGFRVEPQHCNTRPVCHGGMLATFLDVALARGLRIARDVPIPLPTVSLSLDYLAPAALGDWVDARVLVSRAGRGICFVQAMLHANGEPVLRGSGVYKPMRRAA